MKMSEARGKGIVKIRKPYWNSMAYLDLLDGSGKVLLVDPPSQQGKGPLPMLSIFADDGKDDWQEYKDPKVDSMTGKKTTIEFEVR
jgi:hypothetical protein